MSERKQSALPIVRFFRDACQYREYLKQSVMRDLRNKYKRSVFGYAWTILNPLGMMAILAFVFSRIMRIPITDYAVFLLPGMLAWNYFAMTATSSLEQVRANAPLFRQVPMPKHLLIVSLAVSNLVNFALALIPLLIIMLVMRRPFSPAILALPITLIPLIAVTLGISLILATSSVFFHDTLHLTQVALQALYFLVPVLYYRELLPAALLPFLVINPLFFQIECIRNLFYAGTLPALMPFAINVAGSLVILAAGIWIFSKNERKFLYYV